MARDDPPSVAVEIDHPQVTILGEIAEDSITQLLDQLRKAEQGDGAVTIEICTLGGDAEAARRMALEIDLARERLAPRRLLFLGKTTVNSAGVTIMGAFPREDRFLTRDAILLIHCRQLEKSLEISGPMRGSEAKIDALLHQIRCGIEQEKKNFAWLIEGSDIAMEELLDRALYNWYRTAEEALRRGLVAELV